MLRFRLASCLVLMSSLAYGQTAEDLTGPPKEPTFAKEVDPELAARLEAEAEERKRRAQEILQVLDELRLETELVSTLSIPDLRPLPSGIFEVDVICDAAKQAEQIQWLRDAFERVTRPNELLIVQERVELPFSAYLDELHERLDVVTTDRFTNVLVTSLATSIDGKMLGLRVLYDYNNTELDEDLKAECQRILRRYPVLRDTFKEAKIVQSDLPAQLTNRADRLKWVGYRYYHLGLNLRAEEFIAHAMYEDPNDIESNFLRCLNFLRLGKDQLAEKTLIEYHRRRLSEGLSQPGDSPSHYQPYAYLEPFQGADRQGLARLLELVDLSLASGAASGVSNRLQ